MKPPGPDSGLRYEQSGEVYRGIEGKMRGEHH